MWRRGLWAALAAFALLALGLGTWVAWIARTTPGVPDLRTLQVARPSEVVTADGQPLLTFRRTRQERVSLDAVSPLVVQGLLATEDRRFYDHPGVDWRRTLSAVWNTVNGQTQGGSTITQQLARNLFPETVGRERTITRKLRELITALRIERAATKPQILEAYLNTAPFLYNVVGIEMAARTYFNKSARELGPLEAATLVGMLKGTAYYNPILHPERARARRNVVLAQMQRSGVLEAAQVEALRAAPLALDFNRPVDEPYAAPHYALQVRRFLLDWADANDRDLYTEGLRIETTLDTRLQQLADEAVERETALLQQVAAVEWSQARLPALSTRAETYAKTKLRGAPFAHLFDGRPDLLQDMLRETPAFRDAVKAGATEAQALARLAGDAAFVARLREEKTRLEAGFVAIDPATGEVKAWVGSRDHAVDQFDHVAQAARQPGSTFKPFVYAAALEIGIPPQHPYLDEPKEFRQRDGSVWKPTDMGGSSGAPMAMRDGLVYSKNTITAQVIQDVGVPRIAETARAAGIDRSRLDPVPSLGLGTSPVTLFEMVNAYATIARQGEYREPVLVRRIRDREGRLVAEFVPRTRPAISPQSTVELIDMMRGVIDRGTGTQIRNRFGIDADVAGKTGTSQKNTDGWFILMHPRLVAGAWVGFNDARVTMRSDHWGQGGHNALLLVGDFFRATLKRKLVDPEAEFPDPPRPEPSAMPGAAPGTESAAASPSLDADAMAGLLRDAPTAAGRTPAVVIEERPDGRRLLGDRAGVEALRRSGPTPQEVERALDGLTRDRPVRPGTAAPEGEVPSVPMSTRRGAEPRPDPSDPLSLFR